MQLSVTHKAVRAHVSNVSVWKARGGRTAGSPEHRTESSSMTLIKSDTIRGLQKQEFPSLDLQFI